jgi:hypothetical protein
MTAAEKAKDLVNEKYYQPLTLHLNVNNNSKQMWEYAKQCALIAVCEIVDALMQVIGDQRHMWSEHQLSEVLYWASVKNEIETL